MIRIVGLLLCLLFTVHPLFTQIREVEQEYVTEWKKFYPTKALDQGFHSSIFYFENFDLESIGNWVSYNEEMLVYLDNFKEELHLSDKINIRILKSQIKKELYQWKINKEHQTSFSVYTSLLGQSLRKIVDSKFLTDAERKEVLLKRLPAIFQLCQSAIENTSNRLIHTSQNTLRSISSLRDDLRSDWMEELVTGRKGADSEFFEEERRAILNELSTIENQISNQLSKKNLEKDILGEDLYSKSLSLYTDTELSPDQLLELAMAEITEVSSLILQKSKEYLSEEYTDKALPKDAKDIIRMAFRDMERDAPLNGEEYLTFWQDLAESARAFIVEKEIATLPNIETLRIAPAPESAGPASRIGWVDSAPSFAPNPITTLYLPSIPDSLPEQDKKDFWASFNKPFNRMIVIHELYPGHYMQIKKSRKSPYDVRLLFPYGPYFEGWASFCEIVALDAGWDSSRPLTYLAHLRKRLENANRAYTSVMAHCKGWSKEEVMNFSIETSLLAPQFAKSLWERLMRSPMQMTSYFLGGIEFRKLLATEQKRMGANFVIKDFMDTIMKCGPIPIDEFYEIFRESTK